MLWKFRIFAIGGVSLALLPREAAGGGRWDPKKGIGQLRGYVAMQWFLRAARSGWAEAQTAIAQNYRARGDNMEAVRWYRLAAEQGEYAALLAMGEMSAKGEGMPQDNEAAATWLRRALEWGYEAWDKRTWALLGRNL
jgi:uncharacterized protein